MFYFMIILRTISQQNRFDFDIQLLVSIRDLITTITMLLKCIQNLHERPALDIAHYKNHEPYQTWDS